MVRKRTVAKFIGHLQELLASGLSRSAYLISKDMGGGYFSITFTKMLNAYNEGELDAEQFNEIVDLMSQIDSKYEKYKNLESETPSLDLDKPTTALVDIQPDNEDGRTTVSYERDADGKIQYYNFKICRRDKEPLVGKLSRDEANTIYRLYSFYGQSLTQREVSRYFPEWSLVDFKRILSAFHVFKASAPLAPHVIEEHTNEELLEMQMRDKENDFLRKLEAEEIKQTKKLLNKYAQDNADLRKKLKDSQEIMSSFNLVIPEAANIVNTVQENNETLFIWLSDMHVGAKVADESIYDNHYDLDVVQQRLTKLLNIATKGFKEIIVCNIGDSLDGQDGMTVKRTHQLPQNMTNKEQVHGFINVMYWFMSNLAHYCDELSYYCVGDSNHDGILGYTANLGLASLLESQGIKAEVFPSFIGHFEHNNTTYVLCHGKDGKDMFKNWPLVLDLKTENYINEYLDYEGISGNVVVIKGDLHQSATSYGRRFKYKSVGSLFGSSEWIHKNFGNSSAACDYTIVSQSVSTDGRIVF